MSNGNLPRIAAKTAAEVCKHCELDEEPRQLLQEGMTPGQFIEVLVAKEHFAAAIRFLAHALPKREAIWWSLLCARQVAGPKPNPAVAGALTAIEKWVADPTEENRQPLFALAEAANLGTPAGCTAAAGFFSGGSLGPPSVKPIPPGEWLTAAAVAGAIQMAPVTAEPQKAPEKYRQFLTLGLEVASGKSKWT